MIFEPLALDGAYLIKPELHEDERGFFARSFCKEEFKAHGLVDEFVQCDISYNRKKGTLRGMHYQLPPHEETKLVRCTKGRIYDVIVDIRKESQTRGKWCGIELTDSNQHMLYIPNGFAHGFLTLADDTEVFYQMSTPYNPDTARTMYWNHESVSIDWPFEPNIISSQDNNATDYPLVTR